MKWTKLLLQIVVIPAITMPSVNKGTVLEFQPTFEIFAGRAGINV